MFKHISIGCFTAALLCSCTSLDLIHDPQTGLIDRGQVRDFIKSVRCELKTFYSLNKQNTDNYQSANKQYLRYKAAKEIGKAEQARLDAIRAYPHFLLSDKLFGGVFLDLKVVDTVGIGAADTSDSYKHVLNPTHTVSWVFAPTANTANTYEMNYSFIIDQSTGLASTDADASVDDFKCYSALGADTDLYLLAKGEYLKLQNFKRIAVNGVEPLAAWLLDNSRDLWDNFEAKSDAEQSEQIIGTQMNYNFLVQITAGIDARYSLTSKLWNPAQFGAGASDVQTSQMQFYLNGYDASLPGGAKTGTAVIATTSGTPSPPTIIPIGDLDQKKKENAAKLAENKRKIDAILEETGESHSESDQLKNLKIEQQKLLSIKKELDTASKPRVTPTQPGQSRGYLLYPPAILPPQ